MAKTVRYATTGINVRDAAAGAITRTINTGYLMVHDSADAPVIKALSGTNYTWIKVTYYYQKPNSQVVGGSDTGWVARENTAAVSTTMPSKSSVVSGNKYLTQTEMLVNARYIYNYLLSRPTATKWTEIAIGGMMGNLEQESNINPGFWQDLNSSNTKKGFGLTQWTPSTKLTDWLPSGANKSDIDKQLERILHEVQNDSLQWQKSLHTPQITFKQYSQMTGKNVTEMAEYFLRCYEDPDSVSSKVQDRKDLALKWNWVTYCLDRM